MYVRINDNSMKRFYKSMVYGLINTGYYEQAIVFNPYIQCFEIVDYLNKSTKNLTPNYEVINNNRVEWATYEKAYLLKFKKYLSENGIEINIQRFQGYKDIFENYQFLSRIISEKTITLSQALVSQRINEDTDIWNYINTQYEADAFMKMFVGFHDATLDYLSYEEESGKRQLILRFDNSRWFGVIECCFEGLIALNLRPYRENSTRDIYGATLLVINETVFWADDELESENLNYDGTYIKALSMKWRKL